MKTKLTEQGRLKYAELRRGQVNRPRTRTTLAQLRASVYSMNHAARTLERVRAWEQDSNRKPIYTRESIWASARGNNGKPFAAHGETVCRWIENPESMGLRFIGLAHDVYPRGIKHTGWFMDSDGFRETVAGVVYQLPARNGRSRYLAGYADPWNCDSNGNGPALLSLEVFEADLEWERETARRQISKQYWTQDMESLFYWTESAGETARQEAARRADGIAESMAESEREYQDSFSAGSIAHDAARETFEAGKALIESCRTARQLWKLRQGFTGFTAPFLRDHLRRELKLIRELRETYSELRETSVAMFDAKPVKFWRDQNCVALDGWREGYGESV